MPSRKKAEPTRRPAKAKGALPAPRVAPRRVRVPLHRRRPVQVIAILLVLTLAGVVFLQFSRAREETAERNAEKRAIRRFDSSVKLIETSLSKAIGEMSQIPEQFRSGATDAATFKAKTDEWVKTFRDAANSLAEKTVDDSLEEARALFHHGAIYYVDAVKLYQTASGEADAAQRNALLDQGRNLTDHAGKVMGLGKRALIIEKTRVGIPDEEKQQYVDLPIPLPQEDVPAQPPPPPGLEGQPPPVIPAGP